MKAITYIAGGTLLLFALFSCENKWEEHYKVESEYVNMNLWDAIQQQPELSLFVQYIKEFKYDTLFQSDNPYTLFIPDNDAFAVLTDTGAVTRRIMDYLISLHFIQSRNVKGKKKVQTLAEKFALFENTGSGIYFDGISLDEESPLFLNGKYFVMGQVPIPKPNLYEFFALENPILTKYIDSFDSIILDKELSRAIGFDSLGNTVYDTVSETINIFEEENFPVSEEFRSKTATIVFPREDDYHTALDEMAASLDAYTDYSDIPLTWQYDVLIPYLLERGIFENMIEPYEFIKPPYPDTLKMKNIQGDSVYIYYDVADKVICSNGYAYNYADFTVPDTLYKGSTRFEAEWLMEEIGINKYAWLRPPVLNVSSTTSFAPFKVPSAAASNDTLTRVSFQKGYSGTFSLTFRVDNLFPRKYLMVVRTHMYWGGIWDIYVNDELVKEDFDYYTYVQNRELYYSVTGKRFKPDGALNIFDCFVDNTAPYGQATVKFVYKAPGQVQNNGLVIDYIDFVPYDF